jgi:hypothetical protein
LLLKIVKDFLDTNVLKIKLEDILKESKEQIPDFLVLKKYKNNINKKKKGKKKY